MAAKKSEVLKSHNMVGSSLLFILDDEGNCKLKLIDFAKSTRIASDEGRRTQITIVFLYNLWEPIEKLTPVVSFAPSMVQWPLIAI